MQLCLSYAEAFDTSSQVVAEVQLSLLLVHAISFLMTLWFCSEESCLSFILSFAE
jgi:hypothetical protein